MTKLVTAVHEWNMHEWPEIPIADDQEVVAATAEHEGGHGYHLTLVLMRDTKPNARQIIREAAEARAKPKPPPRPATPRSRSERKTKKR